MVEYVKQNIFVFTPEIIFDLYLYIFLSAPTTFARFQQMSNGLATQPLSYSWPEVENAQQRWT